MKKSTLFSLLAIFILIPLTLFLGTRVKGRWYYLISTMIILELMLPFFFRFEARKPQARELVILTVMAALARGLPLVAVPVSVDQPYHAHRLEAAGAAGIDGAAP